MHKISSTYNFILFSWCIVLFACYSNNHVKEVSPMDIEKYRSSLLRKHYSKKKSLIHLVIVSDLDFMKQYRLTLEKMEEYATKHNYSLTILNKDFFQEKNQSLMSCVYHKNFYFLKHCMIATYMGFPSFSSDDIFLFLMLMLCLIEWNKDLKSGQD